MSEERNKIQPGHKLETIPPNPMFMVQAAIERGLSGDDLSKMLDLAERYESGQARRAYVQAMAAFKSEPMEILKTRKVNIQGGAKFAHATLADVVDAVCSALSKHGLSHRWDIEQGDGMIRVTCVITHEAGHSERVTMSAPPDDSGKKNSIQQVASTVTYLERYSLMAATGLAARDMDDDARGAAAPAVEKPDGYDSWKADMTALADEGIEALQKSWGGTDPAIRRYVVKQDDVWWQETKRRAARVAA